MEKIGNATLYLGDAASVVHRLDDISLVITDPPYSSGARTDSEKQVRGSMLRSMEDADKAALDWCDTLVLLLPCGRSAHLEAGYACGQGKRVVALLHEDRFEPELMYLLCDGIVSTVPQLLSWLKHSVRLCTTVYDHPDVPPL